LLDSADNPIRADAEKRPTADQAVASSAVRWQALVAQIARFGTRKAQGLVAARSFVEEYRALEHDVAARAPGTYRDALESVYLNAQEQLLRPAYNLRSDVKRWFMHDVPSAFYAMRREILIAIVLFLGFAALGWGAVKYSEELAGLFMDPRQMDEVRAGKVWTDGIFGVTPAAVLSFQITLNNILVTLFAFGVGVFYGLGTLYILAVNGSMLGALFAFTYSYGVGDRLLNFIPAHGMVELFVICLGAGCGLHVGDALVNPGMQARAEAFRSAISRATPVLLYGCAGLLVCGVIEGYVSPNPAVGFSVRVAIGLSWFLLFLAGLTGVLYRKRSGAAQSQGQK
jgi:uncharacterized membrane protein SpoIIM required for sporulation